MKVTTVYKIEAMVRLIDEDFSSFKTFYVAGTSEKSAQKYIVKAMEEGEAYQSIKVLSAELFVTPVYI